MGTASVMKVTKGSVVPSPFEEGPHIEADIVGAEEEAIMAEAGVAAEVVENSHPIQPAHQQAMGMYVSNFTKYPNKNMSGYLESQVS